MPKKHAMSANRNPAGRPKQVANRRKRVAEPTLTAPAESGAPVATSPVRPTTPTRTATRPSPPPLRVNYDYVVRDLRRIAITACVLVAGLVGLSFVVR